jgi:methyl-accepting chemotaxis protein
MRQLSINTLCTLFVTLSFFFLLVVLVVYISTSSYNMVLKVQTNALDQTAQVVARSAQSSIEESAALAKSLAGQQAVAEAFTGSPARAQELFRSSLAAFPTYWSFFLFDTKGRVLAGINAEQKDLTGGDRADRDYSKAIFGGKDLAFSQGIMKATTGDALIYVIAQAVHGQDGKLLGAVAVCPRWSDFTAKIIDSVRFGQRGYGLMLDEKGRIIAHGTEKGLLLTDVSQEDFARQALSRDSGVFSYFWKGKKKIMAVAKIPATAWIVCMTASDADLLAGALTQRSVLVGVGLAATLLLALFLTFINRRFVFNPLRALSGYTQRVAAGDFATPMGGPFRAELAVFAGQLQGMAEELKKRLGFSEGVLNSIPLPTTILDAQCHVLWVNQHSCDLLEKTGAPASYVGVSSGEFILNDATKHPLVDKAVTEKLKLSTTSVLTVASGKKYHISVNASPIFDRDGTFLGGMVFWNDLTEQKRQQTQIEEQNTVISQAASQASEVSDHMASAVDALSTRIKQANAGASEQNGRVHDTVAAMEEMNATILEVAKNASDTAKNTEVVREKAHEGANLVVQVVDAIGSVREVSVKLKSNMGELGQNAQGIGSVLGVISDIADQTNLLALNAAIEAARAGDAGRGFAVVADEVRKLAEKTVQATKEVGEAITGIQHRTAETTAIVDVAARAVEQTTVLAQNSGQALQEIVSMVEVAGDQVRSIATSAQQQSVTSEEINRAIESISRIASETAEAMAQSTQDVTELGDQARNLRILVAEIRGDQK